MNPLHSSCPDFLILIQISVSYACQEDTYHAKFSLSHAMKVQNSILRSIIFGATKHGANFHQLCKEVGIDPTELNDAEKLSDWEVSAPAWDYALAMTGDPLLALHLGEEADFSTFGMLGFLMQSCPTLEAAITTLVKYNNTLSTIFHFSSSISADTYRIYFEPVPVYLHKYPESARQAVEMGMSGFTKVFHILTGKKIYPLQAVLAFPKRQVREYERIFQAQIIFDAERSCLVYRKHDLSHPIISYDTSLYSFFNLMLAEKQQALDVDRSIADEIKEVLLRAFYGQVPPVEVVAAQMNMSLRTFQRKLAQEKVTFRQIANDVKKELAIALINDPRSKTADVAHLLGYADLSSFRRAYKKWRDHTSYLANTGSRK